MEKILFLLLFFCQQQISVIIRKVQIILGKTMVELSEQNTNTVSVRRFIRHLLHTHVSGFALPSLARKKKREKNCKKKVYEELFSIFFHWSYKSAAKKITVSNLLKNSILCN